MPSTPTRVIVDTGPIVALFDSADAHHDRTLKFLRATHAELISSMAVVTEAMYVMDASLKAQKNLLTWIRDGGMTLVEPGPDDFDRVMQLIEKYADLPMDFTDGVLVALCERLDIKHVATVDRDFSVYRFKGRGKFVNVLFGS